MSDLNNVVLVGRLTRDAELRQTSGGTSVTKFSIAVSGWNGTKEVSNFFDCVLWGKKAEAVTKYLVKGQQVAVSGELKQNRWEGKDGKTQSKVEISVQTVQLVGGKKSAGEPQEKREFSDDIPF